MRAAGLRCSHSPTHLREERFELFELARVLGHLELVPSLLFGELGQQALIACDERPV
jgi:hypothetical protein